MTLWIDADACPAGIRDMVTRAALRTETPLVLVANSHLPVPKDPLFSLVIVPHGADEADNYIAEHCTGGDLVITADVPLAARVVEKGATGLDPRGTLYTTENIGERLAMRNFMEEMRSGGMVEGGPASPTSADTAAFANALDRYLANTRRNG